MMRVILFKAKRKDNGEWVEGQYAYICNPHTESGEPVKHLICNGTNVFNNEIDPETLCQYTGKMDEDRNKIFEGDIVGFIDLYSTESGYSESNCLGEVIWSEEECCFHVTNRLSAESWEVLNECKVVGNIFDNPELLEGE